MIRLCRHSINAWEWVFEKGTRTVEVINIFLLVSWAMVYAFRYNNPESMDVFARIGFLDGYLWAVWMSTLAIVQILLMSVYSYRLRVLTGLTLIVSCVTWLFVSITFLNTPIIVTGVSTYAVWAFFCAGAGSRTMWLNDESLSKCRESPELINSKYSARGKDECTTDRNNSATVTTSHFRNNRWIPRCSYPCQKRTRWATLKHRIHLIWSRLRYGRK